MDIPIRTMAGPVVKSLKSTDGCDLYAEAIGDHSNPHVVLLHGMGSSAAIFDVFCHQYSLVDNLYIVRYDMRGHGRSGMPETPEGHLSKLHADDFMTVLQAFELDTPILVGWSLGAVIAADLCEHVRPLPISGIMYMSGHISVQGMQEYSSSPFFQETIKMGADPVNEPTALRLLIDACFISPRNVPVAYPLRCFWAGMFFLQPRTTRGCWLTRPQNTAPLFKALGAGLPVFTLYGTHDKLVDNAAVERELRRHATNLEVKKLLDFGHAVSWEDPEEAAWDIINFANKVWAEEWD
ncbi:hypothetical protein EWM64_g3033 [Hericium alpestre]|uniref:AB hydrolase-1 domain-containing protein n=1 Tax=Hericium alpestre TaxID=135208 RepID=A0A4Z0A1L5_9AGAM|nr:hypothetical protein EWM64_g3033 [Hericium alpestre]